MKVGFTGTRAGMTAAQQASVIKLLQRLDYNEAHAGDCVGADREFIAVARFLKPKAKMIGHIPDSDEHRAFSRYDEQRRPLPYMERNANIVKEADMMIATPKEQQECLRSGTWATIRKTIKAGKKLYIVWPDGSTMKWRY